MTNNYPIIMNISPIPPNAANLNEFLNINIIASLQALQKLLPLIAIYFKWFYLNISIFIDPADNSF